MGEGVGAQQFQHSCWHGANVDLADEVERLLRRLLAGQRFAELEACEVPAGHIHMIVNRWERGHLSIPDVEKILGRPVFGTLPNDYARVRESILESRLVSQDSDFAEGCRALARKLSGLPDTPPSRSGFGLLKKLGRITS